MRSTTELTHQEIDTLAREDHLPEVKQDNHADTCPEFSKISIWRRLAAELFGIFLLTLLDVGITIIGKISNNEIGVATKSVIPGLLVIVLIYAIGNISGAHINPAVTVAFALRRVFPWRYVPLYLLTQFIGAILATILLYMLFGANISLGVDYPKYGINFAFAIETTLTTLLITVILSTATRHKVIGTNAAIAVGGTIILCGLFAKAITPVMMNPARFLGPIILLREPYTETWIYLLGPFIGSIIAVLLTQIMHGRPNSEEAKAAQGDGK